MNEIEKFLDLTSLAVTDTERSIREWVQGIDQEPAAVCVYPNFVDVAGLALGDSPVRVASVVGGFPAGQTYLEVKMLEAAMAVENGADEVDVVMNVGAFLEGCDDVVRGEIEMLRGEVGEDVTLKVIIESGVLGSSANIRRAALLVARSGADFVKTSTGKASVGATPEVAEAICAALKEHFEATGRRVGFKAAGGIRTREDAMRHMEIVRRVLGEEWLTPALFRIGTSVFPE